MEPVRLGLAGYGFGGRYFHAPLITSAQNCELVAVVTSSPDRQALVGQDHPGIPTVTTLAELLNRGAEAVVICTPASTHTGLTEQALRLGLAVVSGQGDRGDLEHLGGHLVVGLGVAEPGLAGGAGLVRAVGAGGSAPVIVVGGYVERGDDGADFGAGEDDRVVGVRVGWSW